MSVVRRQLDVTQLKGDWALVTGASAGIGKEFCIQLAQHGMNVIMVARRQHLLDALAHQLEDDFKIRCLPIALSLDDPQSITKIRKVVNAEKIKIRLLVNNAGINYYGRFESMDAGQNIQMMYLNIVAVSLLCREFLNDLKDFPTSAIVNISSQAALNPIPGAALYAATKAFVHSLSLSLYEELKRTSVIVQTVIPCPTETESSRSTDVRFGKIKGWRSVTEVVKISLDHLKIDEPVTAIAENLFIQKLFVNLMSEKVVLAKMGSIFLDRNVFNKDKEME